MKFLAFRRSKFQKTCPSQEEELLRRVIASEMVSIDGFSAGPNGQLDWFVQDEELDRYAAELLNSVDTILYRRATTR